VFDRPAGSTARRGAYVIREAAGGKPEVILIGTGSEVAIALEAADLLAKESGPAARVVSMPSWEIFAEQDAAWRDAVLPPSITARVAVEAATTFGWERQVGSRGAVVGIDRFGESGKYEEVYQALGITARAVADAARRVASKA
jgi:transketolase